MTKESLGLVPLDFHDQKLLEKLAFHLGNIFPIKVKRGAALALPERAYNFHRRQFNSSVILNRLKRKVKGFAKILAVTENDLYAEGLNFVFGEADPASGLAIISLSRLSKTDARLNHIHFINSRI